MAVTIQKDSISLMTTLIETISSESIINSESFDSKYVPELQLFYNSLSPPAKLFTNCPTVKATVAQAPPNKSVSLPVQNQ